MGKSMRARKKRKRWSIQRFWAISRIWGGQKPLGGLPPKFFGHRCPGPNHVFQIWWRSVQGFSVGWGSNFAIPHWLWRSSLQHFHTTVWAFNMLQSLIDSTSPSVPSQTRYSTGATTSFRGPLQMSFTCTCLCNHLLLEVMSAPSPCLIVNEMAKDTSYSCLVSRTDLIIFIHPSLWTSEYFCYFLAMLNILATMILARCIHLDPYCQQQRSN